MTSFLLVIAASALTGFSPVRTAGPDPSPFDVVRDQTAWTSPDGRDLIFCLLGYRNEERARTIAVYERGSHGCTRIFLDRDRGFHPWTIAMAELDGDSLPEVIVGVYKKSRFDPIRRNRVFVFDWTREGSLFAKWLGSRLAFPFDDLLVVPGSDGRDRLLTRNRLEGGSGGCMRRYAWNGFGFSPERQPEITRN